MSRKKQATQSAADEPQASARPPAAFAVDDIARRAYELSQSPEHGTDEENWLRAERELRDG